MHCMLFKEDPFKQVNGLNYEHFLVEGKHLSTLPAILKI